MHDKWILNVLPLLVIPALNPDEKLLYLWEAYRQSVPGAVGIVVNDGSTKGLALFETLAQQGCIVLHHTENQGKGAALKTAIHYFLEHHAASYPGIVTADADGQHTVSDILQVSEAFAKAPTYLHLGVRDWQGAKIPWRSRMGNQLTRWLFNAVNRAAVQDTQTGLRAIPPKLLKPLLATQTTRFEFEFEMFFIAQKHRIALRQIPIQTLYIEANRHSHFRPLWDSLRIYFIFIRFSVVALLSFLLDFTVFSLMYGLGATTGQAILGARLISSPFNFIFNKKAAFHAQGKWLHEAILYFTLVGIAGWMAFQLMLFLHFLGLNMYVSKILAESLIFLMNFFVQSQFIFTKRGEQYANATE